MPRLSKYQIDVLLQKQAELYTLQQGYGIGAELAGAMAAVRDQMTALAADAIAVAADAGEPLRIKGAPLFKAAAGAPE